MRTAGFRGGKSVELEGLERGFSDGCRVDKSGYSFELTDNTSRMLATLSTVCCNTKLVTQIRHTAGTFATNFTNLTIGNLAADTNVHGEILKVGKS